MPDELLSWVLTAAFFALIPFQEVTTLLKSIGEIHSAESVRHFFAECDEDKSGTISLPEFMKARKQLKEAAIFAEFDSDGNGFLDHKAGPRTCHILDMWNGVPSSLRPLLLPQELKLMFRHIGQEYSDDAIRSFMNVRPILISCA